MPEIDKNPQLDERIWRAWIQKNEAQDKVRFTRRVRVIALASAFAAPLLLWLVAPRRPNPAPG